MAKRASKTKRVYYFGVKKTEGAKEMKELLGGKGAVEELLAVEGRGVADAVQLGLELGDFLLQRDAVTGRPNLTCGSRRSDLTLLVGDEFGLAIQFTEQVDIELVPHLRLSEQTAPTA